MNVLFADDAQLLFIDNFDGTTLNTSKWTYRQLNKKRNDAYVVSNAVKVESGNLKIMVYSNLVDTEYVHYAGMISTESSFKRAYGYYEARIKFNTTAGMWSAFWIQSPTISSSLDFENVAGVEIDVVEHRKIDYNGVEIPNLLAHTLHWGGYAANHKQKKYRQDNMGIGSDYHTYAVEWTPDSYNFYYDGNLTKTWSRVDSVPISQVPQYIIFSTEVKDNNWAGSIPLNGYGSLQNSTTYMMVDWIKVYDKNPYVTTLKKEFLANSLTPHIFKNTIYNLKRGDLVEVFNMNGIKVISKIMDTNIFLLPDSPLRIVKITSERKTTILR